MSFRKLNIGSLINARDLHGLKNRNGKTIKKNSLFRSDALFKISSEDMRRLKEENNLKEIIDFRGEDEINEHTVDPSVDGVKHIYLPLNNGIRNQVTREHKEHSDNKEVEGIINFFYYLDEKADITYATEKLYRQFVSNEIGVKNLSKFLNEVLSCDGLLIYHCTDGKDRTGVATYLLLKILDFDDETIFYDYLLTNENVVEKRKRRRELFLSCGIDNEIILNSSDIIAGVRENWLKAAVDEINSRYQGVDSYIENILGFSKEKREYMQEKYLSYE